MGKRKSKENRTGNPRSNKKNAKESETFLSVQERGDQDTTMSSDDGRRTSYVRNLFRGCCGRLRHSTSQYNVEQAESSSGHLKRTPSQGNDRGESDGQKITNIKMKSLLLHKEKIFNKIQLTNIELESFATDTDLSNIKVEQDTECQKRQKLEAQLKERDNIIEQLNNSIKELERDKASLTSLNTTLTDDTERYREQNEHHTKTTNEMDGKIKKLNENIKTLEDEKQDTLRRMRGVKSQYWSECNDSRSPDKNEYPEHPQSAAALDEVLNENEGQELTNIDNEWQTSLQTELVRLQSMFQNLETLLNDQNTVIEQHENKIHELERNNAALNNSLADQKDKMGKELITQKQHYTNTLNDRERQIQKLNGDYKNLETLLNDQNTVIEQHENKIHELERNNAALNNSLADQKDKMGKELITQKQHYTNMLNDRERQIQKLNGDYKKLDEEKQDALRRLSAMMSTKLRDNNPNIADLSDQFRPTKLGEQFSELYDNEWTDAFDALLSVFEERHAISILLDIVMDSYQFCDTELQRVWQFANDWFIEENAPTTQQLSKTLKDSRKQNISRRMSDIEQKYTRYLSDICDNEGMSKLVTTAHLRTYISTCVRLSLLMTANDPPVVIECPGWQTFSERPYPDEPCSHTSAYSNGNADPNDERSAVASNTLLNNPNDAIENNDCGQSIQNDLPKKKDEALCDTSDDAHNTNISDLAAVEDLPTDQTTSPMSDTTPILDSTDMTIEIPNEDTETAIKDDENNYDQTPAITGEMSTTDTSKTEETPNRSSDNHPELEAKEDNIKVAIADPDEDIEQQGNLNSDGKEKEQDNVSTTTAEKETNAVQITPIYHERKSFDKDKFKEYTSRGPFVDFFVWPIMFLHRDGPMLGKGIAQGSKEKMEDVNREPFVWWKRLPTSQM